MSLSNYDRYILNESIFTDKTISEIINLPLRTRIEIKVLLTDIVENEVNEEVKYDVVGKILDKFPNLKMKLNKKLLNFFINQTEREITKICDKLTIFDPTDFSKIKRVESIYLGGGIDKTPDEYIVKVDDEGINPVQLVAIKKGIFDRIIEITNDRKPEALSSVSSEYFKIDFKRNSKIKEFLPKELIDKLELVTGGGEWRMDFEKEFGEEHVVTGEEMMKISYGKKFDLFKYKKPLIFNPLRNETVRDDDTYKKYYHQWKTDTLGEEGYKYLMKKINKEIKAPDLRVMNECDTNLVRYDDVAGDGTKGELQFGSFKWDLQLFLWLPEGMSMSELSPWTMVEPIKIVRGQLEYKILIESIKKLNKLPYNKELLDELPLN